MEHQRLNGLMGRPDNARSHTAIIRELFRWGNRRNISIVYLSIHPICPVWDIIGTRLNNLLHPLDNMNDLPLWSRRSGMRYQKTALINKSKACLGEYPRAERPFINHCSRVYFKCKFYQEKDKYCWKNCNLLRPYYIFCERWLSDFKTYVLYICPGYNCRAVFWPDVNYQARFAQSFANAFFIIYHIRRKLCNVWSWMWRII